MMKNKITNKCIKPFTFWIDFNGRELMKKDIDDEYLKNICTFVAQGLGYYFFIHNRRRIKRIYKEALKRNLLPKEIILNLRQWALYTHRFSPKIPNGFGS